MMEPIKSESPSPSSIGDGEETESYDLYTPNTLGAGGQATGRPNHQKRQNTAFSANPSSKRPCGAALRNQTSQSKAKASQPVAQSPGKKRSKPPTLVISLDFGTSCTGVASAHTGNGIVEPLLGWDETNKDYVKIPSAIDFGPQNDIWGLDAEHLPGALRWFKLLLVNPSDLDQEIRNSEQLQRARDVLEASGKTHVEAISIFLKRVFDHAVKMLKISMGAVTVDTSRFFVVSSIPAIWPDYARQRMQQAVERAGILKARPIGPTTHDFVTEPEAAALATLSGLDRLSNVKQDDALVIADCGGGTVDIITHKITKTNPMTVEEVVEGKGALCGSIFVSERFKKLVVKKLREKCGDPTLHISEEAIREIMTVDWEGQIRNQFNGGAKTWTIRLPWNLINADRLDPNRGHPTFTITSEEVEEVFRPIVEKIKSLVNDQIEAAFEKLGYLPKYVILVGGFGCSGYVYEYLLQRCQGVEVLQRRGWEPWSAISRGAVIHGLTKLNVGKSLRVTLKSRIARENAGVVCQESWNPRVHYPEDKRFDHILRKDVATKVMKWHVKKGQQVPPNFTVSFDFTKYLDERPGKIVTDIYTSPADQPSQRKDESVMKAYEIVWKFKGKWDDLEIFQNAVGKRFRKLEYSVEMTCSAGATAFSIIHGGKKQAAKDVFLKFD